MEENVQIENTSGGGAEAFVPENIAKRFNWGAFFFTFIWLFWYGQIAMGVIALLSIFLEFIPFGGIVQLALCIFFGIKGNEWAWQAKHYDSFDNFHEVQRKWATVGVVLLVISVLLAIAGFILAGTAVMMQQQ